MGRMPVMLTDAERGLIVVLTKYAIAERTETFERAGAALGAGYPTTQRIKESWAAGLDELRQLAEHVKADPEPWTTVDENGRVMRMERPHSKRGVAMNAIQEDDGHLDPGFWVPGLTAVPLFRAVPGEKRTDG